MSVAQRHNGSTHGCKYHGELFWHGRMLPRQCICDVVGYSGDVPELRQWVRVKCVMQCEFLGNYVRSHGWCGVLLKYCECAQVV
eukprot:3115568-Alexandrium_andersonii.AAC.1